MASEELEFRIIADDKASKVLGDVADDVAKLEGKDATVDVTADDKASKTLDNVDRDRKQLDGKDAEVDIKADDKATKDLHQVDADRKQLDGKDATVDVKANDKATQRLDDVLRRTKDLDGTDATVILKAEAGKATSEIRQLTRLLGEVDGNEATVVLKAKDEASARLKTIQRELDRIDATHATASVGTIGGAAGGAEGAIAKMVTMGTTAFGALHTAIGVASAGGAVAVAGAIRLVEDAFTKFQETARAARDLGAAAGLTSEQASRWIAVADDFGVSAESLTGSIGKIGKSIDQTKWDDYGIKTRDAGGKAREVNDILLDTFDTLAKMPNETERNRAGNELLGKGYKDLAPLIGNTREEMESYLNSVEDGQVITQQEQQKAEEMRKAQDALADAFGEVELAVGTSVSAFSGWVGAAANMVSVAGKVANKISEVFGGADDSVERFADPEKMDQFVANATAAGRSAREFRSDFISQGAAADDVDAALQRAGISIKDYGNIAQVAANEAAILAEESQLNTERAKRLADAQTDLANKTNDVTDAEKSLVDALNGQVDAMLGLGDANIAAADAQDGFAKAAKDSADALAKHGEASTEYADAVKAERDAMIDAAKAQLALGEQHAESEGKTLSATQKVDAMNDSLFTNAKFATPAAKKAAFEYIAQINDIPPEKATAIQALIDQGKWDEAQAAIEEVSKARTVAVTADAHTAEAESAIQELIKARNVKINAELGIKGAAGYTVTVRPGGGTTPFMVAPPAPSTTTVNVNLPRAARSSDVAAALNEHTRRSGRRYSTPVVRHARR